MKKDKSKVSAPKYMSYRLVLREKTEAHTKDIGENVFFNNLDSDYRVFLFYYAGVLPNEELEDKLRDLGEITGKNLFVNIGKLNDPNFGLMVSRFGITQYPVIIMTAVDELASIKEGDFPSAFVRIDSKNLIDSAELTVKSVERIFSLFLTGQIAQAIEKSRQDNRNALITRIRGLVADALKQVAKYLSDKDISISLFEGKFEIKKSGGGE